MRLVWGDRKTEYINMILNYLSKFHKTRICTTELLYLSDTSWSKRFNIWPTKAKWFGAPKIQKCHWQSTADSSSMRISMSFRLWLPRGRNWLWGTSMRRKLGLSSSKSSMWTSDRHWEKLICVSSGNRAPSSKQNRWENTKTSMILALMW